VRVRWLYSEADRRAHILDENDSFEAGTVVTRCRQVFPDTTGVYQAAPSMNLCSRCAVYTTLPPPEHTTGPAPRFP